MRASVKSLALSLALSCSGAALATTAHAAPTFTDSGFVFRPTAGTYTQYGVGAPTVEYDPNNGLYVMFFEYKINAVPSDCSSAYGIGRATSYDGLTWTADANPIVVPSTSSTAYDHCVASQPAIAYDTDAGVWHLLYAIAGAKTTASVTNVENGIAYATSTDGVTFTTVNQRAIPKTGSRAPSMPSAVILDSTLTVVYSEYPNLKTATVSSAGVATVVSTYAVDKSKLAWTSLWALSPALVCDGPTDTHGWPETYGNQFEMIFGGDTTANVRALGYGNSANGSDWNVGLNNLTTGVSGTLNHWDFLRSGADYLMWYSKDYTTNVKGIGFAFADGNADATWTAPDGKYCAAN